MVKRSFLRKEEIIQVDVALKHELNVIDGYRELDAESKKREKIQTVELMLNYLKGYRENPKRNQGDEDSLIDTMKTLTV